MRKILMPALMLLLCASASIGAKAQQTQRTNQQEQQRQQIMEVVDRIYNYLNGCTPFELVDEKGKKVTDYSKIDENTAYAKGDFGISTYEWGVTYSAMLMLSDVTGDGKYADYTFDRLKFLGDIYPYVDAYHKETGYDMKLSYLYTPRFLDDCGAMCAAMIKATLRDPQRAASFRGLLDNWFNFVMYKEYRLGNGILARNRPTTNSVWLDDMYMGIPPIAYRAKLMQKERGDLTEKYYAEAVSQIDLFRKYLWIPEVGYFRHGWIEGMSEHPNYFWARCNGWAMLTLCDVLDAIPQNQQGRDEVIELLTTQIRNIAPYQSASGLWHQLLDKNDSYLETSASAIYTYCIAHAINNGWIDGTAYQDIAKSGWAGVMTQVNAQGQVENTCVGTGLGWTNTFYYNRPVSVYAAHGYGPVLLAAAEILKLNGLAVQPDGQQATSQRSMPPFPQAVQRVKGKPMVFLAGDSTCKNGRGTGDNGQWGWGSFFAEYLNDGVTVSNDAVGGLSSRTFYNGNWPAILSRIEKGDFVLIQFGHNDMAPLNTGRARGTLNGTGDEKQTVVMEKNGGPEDVYSYGHYIRMMVRQAKLRGATPIVLSPTPQNNWMGENSERRFTDTFNAWCQTVAKEEGVLFVNFNDLAASQYEKIGRTAAQADYFSDSVHTKEKGARLNCQILIDGLKAARSPLARYAK